LNDAEDDDVDVYDDGLRSGGRRVAFEAGNDEDESVKLKKEAPPGSSVRLTDLVVLSANKSTGTEISISRFLQE
jgi:hypothetical protein